MQVDPWRLGHGRWEKIEHANIAGQVVGTEVNEDGGRWDGSLRGGLDSDAPEAAGREIAAERGDVRDARARPSPSDGLCRPCLECAAVIHRRWILAADGMLARV